MCVCVGVWVCGVCVMNIDEPTPYRWPKIQVPFCMRVPASAAGAGKAYSAQAQGPLGTGGSHFGCVAAWPCVAVAQLIIF